MGNKNGRPVLSEGNVEFLVRSSGCSMEEIKETFNEFVLAHPTGKVSKQDFIKMMQKALPNKDATKMYDHVFRVYDKDNNGFIDFVEFMVVYQIMADGKPEDVLRQIFRVFDVNQDGYISPGEMKRLVRDMMLLIKDEDNPEKATDEMIAGIAFAEMDLNADQKITPDEFVDACMVEDRFCKMLALKVIDIFVGDKEEDKVALH